MLNRRKNQGFTVLEMLASASLGMVIIAGAYAFLSKGEKASLRQQVRVELISAVQTATDTLNYDLKMAGHYGGAAKGLSITEQAVDRELDIKFCIGRALDLRLPVHGVNGGQNILCNMLPGMDRKSDLLFLSYASHRSYDRSELQPDKIYLRHGPSFGEIMLGSELSSQLRFDSPILSYREFFSILYYIKKSVGSTPPALMRAVLYDNQGQLAFRLQPIATGVEAIAFSLLKATDCVESVCDAYRLISLGDSRDQLEEDRFRMAEYEMVIRSNKPVLPKGRDVEFTLRDDAPSGGNFGLMRFERQNVRYAYEYVAQSVSLPNNF